MGNKHSPIREKFLVFGSPLIEEDEIREVEETLRPGWIGTGPRVSKFERMFGDYIGSQYNIARHSCTVSLHHSMLVDRINPGDFPDAEYISERTIYFATLCPSSLTKTWKM